MISQYDYNKQMGMQAAYTNATATGGPSERAIVDALAGLMAGKNASTFSQKYGTELNRIASMATNAMGISTQPMMAAAVQGAFGSGNMGVDSMDGRRLGHMQGRGFGTMQMGTQFYQGLMGDFYNQSGGANYNRTFGLSPQEQSTVIETTLRRNSTRLNSTQLGISAGSQGEGISQALQEYKKLSGYDAMGTFEKKAFEANDRQFADLQKLQRLNDPEAREKASSEDRFKWESINAGGSYVNVLNKDSSRKLRDTIASGNEAMASLKDVFKELGSEDLMKVANEMGYSIGKSDRENRELKSKLDDVKKRAEHTGQDARTLIEEEGAIVGAMSGAFGFNKLGASAAGAYASTRGDIARENAKRGGTAWSAEEMIQYRAEQAGEQEQYINKDMGALMMLQKRVAGTEAGSRMQDRINKIMSEEDPTQRAILMAQLKEETRAENVGGSRNSRVWLGLQRGAANDVDIQKDIQKRSADLNNSQKLNLFTEAFRDTEQGQNEGITEGITALVRNFGVSDIKDSSNADTGYYKAMKMLQEGKSPDEIRNFMKENGASADDIAKVGTMAESLSGLRGKQRDSMVSELNLGVLNASGIIGMGDYEDLSQTKSRTIRENADWAAERGTSGSTLSPGGDGLVKDLIKGFLKEGGASSDLAASFLQASGSEGDFSFKFTEGGAMDFSNVGNLLGNKEFMDELGVGSEEELKKLAGSASGMNSITRALDKQGYGISRDGEGTYRGYNRDDIQAKQKTIDAAGGIADVLEMFGGDVKTRMGESGWEVGTTSADGSVSWKSKEDAISELQSSVLDPGKYDALTLQGKEEANEKMMRYYKAASSDDKKKFEEKLHESQRLTMGSVFYTSEDGKMVMKEEMSEKLYNAMNSRSPDAVKWGDMDDKQKKDAIEKMKTSFAKDTNRMVSSMIGDGEVDDNGKFTKGQLKGMSSDSEEARAVLDTLHRGKLESAIGSNNPMGGVEDILKNIYSLLGDKLNSGGIGMSLT